MSDLDLLDRVAHLSNCVNRSSKRNMKWLPVLKGKWMRDREKLMTKDNGRKWMWMFLAAVVLLQMYFVWELLAVFALFAVGFAAIASVIGSLYMLQRGWALAVERIADSRHPIMVATRQGFDAIEDVARRPFRRPGSAPAR
jgi:hypothetical protein